jgi:predicted site-specific integrase-resolvase
MSTTEIDGPILAQYVKGDAGLARELGVNPRTIYRWRTLGSGPPVTRMGGRILYHKQDVSRWLESRREEQAA